MPEIPHRVKRTALGKMRVKYACPQCRGIIENELSEAGSPDKCPACDARFVVPGVQKKQDIEAQLRQKQAEKAEAKRVKNEDRALKRLSMEQDLEAAAQAEADAEAEANSALRAQLVKSQEEKAARDALPPTYGVLKAFVVVMQFTAATMLFFGIISVVVLSFTFGIAGFLGGICCLLAMVLLIIAAEFVQLAINSALNLAKLVEQDKC